MKLQSDQLSESFLRQLGGEVVCLLRAADFSTVAERFGYALAFGRDPAQVIAEDLQHCVGEGAGGANDARNEASVAVKFLAPNDIGLRAVVECRFSGPENCPVLAELIVTRDTTAYFVTLEQISLARAVCEAMMRNDSQGVKMNSGIFAEAACAIRDAARTFREARPDLIFFARRGLPCGLATLFLSDLVRIIDAGMGEAGLFTSMPWPQLAMLGLMVLLAVAGWVCAIFLPRHLVWLMLGLLIFQLALLLAAGAMREAFLVHQEFRHCILFSLPGGAILAMLAYALRRVTPRPPR